MPQSRGNKRLEKIFSNTSAKQRIGIKRIISNLFYHTTHSNLELSKITEFSIPTVSALLDTLIDSNLVQPTGQGSSSGGRKPQQYGLSKTFGYIVAVYIDQYYTHLAILSLTRQHVVEPRIINLNLYENKNGTSILCESVKQFVDDSKIDKDEIIGVGVGMPGLIDVKKGLNHTFFQDADNGIRQLLSEKLSLPVFIENDSNVLALGETKFGFAKYSQNVLVVNASWGVGLGMVLNGELFHGHAGFAGEFSHIPLNENGILCSCGKQGCLETECSATALARLAKEGIRNGKMSSLSNMRDEDLEKLEAELVIEAANNGDQYSVQILWQIGYNLGKGLASLIHLLNPEVIVVSGRLAKANKYILTPIEHSLNKYSIPRLRRSTHVVISELSKEAGFMGCASLVIENVFGHTRERFIPSGSSVPTGLLRVN
ncbi:MAG: ROK family protein [Chitinophagaceae bacterium]|nr:ROK family protein [Chitinophagaceae bacterium]